MTRDDLIAFEADISAEFNAGKIRAPVHLAGGNEDQLIDIFKHVRPQDWIATTWRSHYHCLLKGVPPAQLKADIVAGRSIALCYPEHRIVSSAIVGGTLPIALGIAWAIKRAGGDEWVWAFVGDMAAATGACDECVRYAQGHQLPIYFVVEDNGISVCTDTAEAWGGEHNDIGACIDDLPVVLAAPDMLGESEVFHYRYKLPWPHSGAGKRVEF